MCHMTALKGHMTGVRGHMVSFFMQIKSNHKQQLKLSLEERWTADLFKVTWYFVAFWLVSWRQFSGRQLADYICINFTKFGQLAVWLDWIKSDAILNSSTFKRWQASLKRSESHLVKDESSIFVIAASMACQAVVPSGWLGWWDCCYMVTQYISQGICCTQLSVWWHRHCILQHKLGMLATAERTGAVSRWPEANST